MPFYPGLKWRLNIKSLKIYEESITDGCFSGVTHSLLAINQQIAIDGTK
jgi:hypothetical protein